MTDPRWDNKRGVWMHNGHLFQDDEASHHIEEAYEKAERKSASYAARGYWRAAERWAIAAEALFRAHVAVAWTPDREDA